MFQNIYSVIMLMNFMYQEDMLQRYGWLAWLTKSLCVMSGYYIRTR